MAIDITQKYQELQDIKQTQQKAQDLYSQYVGGEYQIPTLVKGEINKRTNFSEPLIKQEAALREQQTTTPTAFAAELKSGRFAGNPILAGQAAAQRQASIQRRLDEVSNMRRERMGTVADITQAVTGGYQAQTARMGAQADLAGQRYNQASQEYGMAYQQQQDELAAERQRQQFEYQKQQDEYQRQQEEAAFAYKQEQDRIDREFQERQFQYQKSNKNSNSSGGGFTKDDISTTLGYLQNVQYSDNPDERKSGQADNFISAKEREKILSDMTRDFDIDKRTAEELVRQAMAQNQIELWVGSDDQWNRVGGRPKTAGPAY